MNRFYRNIDVARGGDTYNQGRPEDFIPDKCSLNSMNGSQSSQINQNTQSAQNTSNSSNTSNSLNSAINTPLYPTDEQNVDSEEFKESKESKEFKEFDGITGFNERLTMSVNPIESTGHKLYAPPYTGMGSLIVRTFTADQALPLENVKVTVTSDEEALSDIHEVRLTDSSGKTEPIKLPAPNAELSKQPQITLRPYAVYNVLCEAEGYTRNSPLNAVVFDDVQSLQNVPLIAKRENEYEKEYKKEYEKESQNK